MTIHKWKIGGKGWWNCTKCGLIREKHYGMPYVYYMDMLTECKAYYDKAPDCPPYIPNNQ